MATDDNYCTHLGVCLTSIMENNKKNEISFHLLNNNISKGNIEKINQIDEKYKNLHVHYYDFNKYFTENDYVDIFDENLKGKNSFFNLLGISTFARLFLADILPETIDKILYLDCDMIVLNDLSELYNTNIKDYYCAGCIESNIPKYVYYGKHSDTPFINAGTLLINLKKWRQENFRQQCIDLIKEYPDKNFLHDQNIINIVARDKIKFVSSKFNANTRNYYVNYGKILKLHKTFGSIEKFDSEEQMKETLKNPTIIHFQSQIWDRPWIKKANLFNHAVKNPFNEKYYFYKELSPWKDEPLQENNKKFTSKLYFEAVRFMMVYLPSPVLIILHHLQVKFL